MPSALMKALINAIRDHLLVEGIVFLPRNKLLTFFLSGKFECKLAYLVLSVSRAISFEGFQNSLPRIDVT